jgi:hypothetical protein
MNAGNALQGYEQASLNDTRSAFERQRDFEMQQRTGYQTGILGGAPTSTGDQQAVTSSPTAGFMGGATQGFGFGQKMFPSITPTATQASVPTNNTVTGGGGFFGGKGLFGFGG